LELFIERNTLIERYLSQRQEKIRASKFPSEANRSSRPLQQTPLWMLRVSHNDALAAIDVNVLDTFLQRFPLLTCDGRNHCYFHTLALSYDANRSSVLCMHIFYTTVSARV
jgi:hypothetical protein